jgi:hypothetical protein
MNTRFFGLITIVLVELLVIEGPMMVGRGR